MLSDVVRRCPILSGVVRDCLLFKWVQTSSLSGLCDDLHGVLVLHRLAIGSRKSDRWCIARDGIWKLPASGTVDTRPRINRCPAAIVLRVSVQVQIGQSILAIDHLLSDRLDMRHANLTTVELTLAL